MVETARDTEPPRQEDRKGDLVELGRRPVRGPIHEPVLEPGAVGTLARLQMAECAKGRGGVAGVEQGRRDAAQIARPHEVIDLVAVVVRLAPWGRRRGHERTGVRFVLQAAKHRE